MDVPSSSNLRPNNLTRLDEIKDLFEAELRSGKSPRIEDWLERVSPQSRESLFKQLLRLELELRRVEDTSFDTSAILKRFASYPSAVDLVLGKTQLGSSADAETNKTGFHAAESGSPESSPLHIGPYRLIEPLGEGGMGVVYRAEQVEPVRRSVALKLIRTGHRSEKIIARFQAERQAIALMNHPNIARILDAGQTDEGLPYFVMELVKGVPITTYCDDHRLCINERLNLFSNVCNAVQHAHQKGIIHRDLKPTNVLVGQTDGNAVPKVIDFGLAKATEQAEHVSEGTMFTHFGQILGTLQYMSPEQAALDTTGVDTRTDVYSLGVLLYELLTGFTPLDNAVLREQTTLKVLESIRDDETPLPSSRLSASPETIENRAAKRRIESNDLRKILKGDLDWVVMKAVEKSRDCRYETVSALAEDIQRYLKSEPIEARPPSFYYFARKTARRHRTAFTITATTLLLLVTGLIVSGAMWFRADAASRRAIRAEMTATQAQDRERMAKEDALKTLGGLYVTTGLRATDVGRPDETILWFASAIDVNPGAPSSDIVRLMLHNWQQSVAKPVFATRLEGKHRIRDLKLHPTNRHLMVRTEQAAFLFDLDEHASDETASQRPIGLTGAWNPSGDRLAVQDSKGDLRIETFPSRKTLSAFSRQLDQPPRDAGHLAFSNDNKWLAVADRNVILLNAKTGKRVGAEHRLTDKAISLQFSQDGRHLVSSTEDQFAQVFAVPWLAKPESKFGTLRFPAVPHAGSRGGLGVVEFEPLLLSNNRFATSQRRAALCVRNLNDGEIQKTIPVKASLLIARASSDGERFVTSAEMPYKVTLHHLQKSEPIKQHVPKQRVTGIAWHEGGFFATVSHDSLLKFFDGNTGDSLGHPTLHRGQVSHVDVSADGNFCATIQADGIIRVFRLPINPAIKRSADLGRYYAAAPSVSSDGQWTVTPGARWGAASTSLSVFRVKDGSQPFGPNDLAVDDSPAALFTSSISPNGKLALAGTIATPVSGEFWDYNRKQGTVRVFDVQSGKRAWKPIATKHAPIGSMFLDDEHCVVATWQDGLYLFDRNGLVKRLDLDDGTGPGYEYPARLFVAAPSGIRFLSMGLGKGVRIWDHQLNLLGRIATDSPVWDAQYSSGGEWLAVSQKGGAVRVYDATTCLPASPWMHQPDTSPSLDFGVDDQVLAVGCKDRMARTWNWRTGQRAGPDLQHDTQLSAVAFYKNTPLLITAENNQLRFWDSRSGMEVAPSIPTQSTETSLVFTPDQTSLMFCGSRKHGLPIHFGILDRLPLERPDVTITMQDAELISNRRLTASGIAMLSSNEWLDLWQSTNHTEPLHQTQSMLEKKGGFSDHFAKQREIPTVFLSGSLSRSVPVDADEPAAVVAHVIRLRQAARALREEGHGERALKQLAPAMAAIDRMHRQFPDRGDVLHELSAVHCEHGCVYRLLGDHEKSFAAFLEGYRTIDHFHDGHFIEQIVDESDAWLLNSLAQVAVTVGDEESAQSMCAAAIQIWSKLDRDTKNGNSTKKGIFWANFHQTNYALLVKDLPLAKDAIAVLKQTLVTNPELRQKLAPKVSEVETKLRLLQERLK